MSAELIDREVEIVGLVTDLKAIPPEMFTDATDSNDEGAAWHAIGEALHAMGWRRGEPRATRGDVVDESWARGLLMELDAALLEGPGMVPCVEAAKRIVEDLIMRLSWWSGR